MSLPGKPNLLGLHIETLKKFKKFYKLSCDDSREKLVMAVSRHFNSLLLDETKVLTRFCDTIKRRKNAAAAAAGNNNNNNNGA